VARKQVFGSEAKLVGKGCQTFALCGGVFVSNQLRNIIGERFFSLVPNGGGIKCWGFRSASLSTEAKETSEK
jgi:hypothetical protein